MPEQMAGTALADVGGIYIIADKLGHPIGNERLAQRGQEQRAVILTDRQLWPHVITIFFDPRPRPLADRAHPILLALALAHHKRAATAVDFEIGRAPCRARVG